MQVRQPARRKIYQIRKDVLEDALNYKKLFRFTKENVIWMSDLFLGQSDESRGGAIPYVNRMEITLRYLANPGFQSGIAHEFGIHQSTVSKIVTDVIEKISASANDWIKFPNGHEETQLAKQNWYDVLEFPCTIGAIDCTHIKIEKPAGPIGNEYINRKGFASVNVQATCNENYVFTSVDASWPGSVHDSRIFRNSNIYQLLINDNMQSILLGDDGYGITPFLLKPYKNPLTPSQKRFNKLHCRARVVIENAFGQVKRRFPIMKYMIRVKLTRIPSYIIACFILHNIAKFLNDVPLDEEAFYEADVKLAVEDDMLQQQNDRQMKLA